MPGKFKPGDAVPPGIRSLLDAAKALRPGVEHPTLPPGVAARPLGAGPTGEAFRGLAPGLAGAGAARVGRKCCQDSAARVAQQLGLSASQLPRVVPPAPGETLTEPRPDVLIPGIPDFLIPGIPGDGNGGGGGCSGSHCELVVFTSDEQLEAMDEIGTHLMSVRDRAFEARQQNPRTALAIPDPHLGGPRRSTAPFSGGPIPGTTVQVASAFMAVLFYDCECVQVAEILWDIEDEIAPDGTIHWRPDAQEEVAKITIGNRLNDEADKFNGSCWKAVVDTPAHHQRMWAGQRPRPDPKPRDGLWRITGHVRWANGSECVKKEYVRVAQGVPRRVVMVGAR